MEEDKKKLSIIIYTIIGICIIAFIILLMQILVYSLEGEVDIDKTEYSGTTGFLSSGLISTLPDIGKTLVSFNASKLNDTWLDFDGINDYAVIVVPEEKETVSLWFKNETTDWTNIIRNSTDVYINAIKNTSWDFYPYYISGNYIYIGKSDDSTFKNVSINEFRVYNLSLNSSQINSIYNESHYN